MAKFRFEDLEIWKLAIEIANELFDIADELAAKHLYSFAEQLRDSGMSMSNNISEGSGSYSNKEFAHFLNVARRSTFECANILVILLMRDLITIEKKEKLYDKLSLESRKISSFRSTLI